MRYLPWSHKYKKKGGRAMIVEPHFEYRRCPQCTGHRYLGCHLCNGTHLVYVPVGIYAEIISKQIMKGAIP